MTQHRELSCNNCCRGKAMSITHLLSVCLQPEVSSMQSAFAILSSVSRPALQNSSTLSHTGQVFRKKKKVKLKYEFWFSLQTFFFLWRCGPTRAMASSFLRFLDHTQWRKTVGRTRLDEWSARRRDLYLTTNNIHNKHSMPPVGFEPTVSAGKRSKTYALDRAATGTGPYKHYLGKILIRRRTERNVIKSVYCSSCKVLPVLVWF